MHSILVEVTQRAVKRKVRDLVGTIHSEWIEVTQWEVERKGGDVMG